MITGRCVFRSALCAFMVCLAAGNAVAAAAERPDIVVFLTDDQSQTDLTPYGGDEFRTPNMQQLAESGMTFTSAYVASPTCAPSRGALLTGLMPARNGAEPNHAKPRAEIKKWPAYFQELGYEVVAFGKVSHYRHTAGYGFDYFAYDTFHDHRGIAAAVEFLQERASRVTRRPLCLMVGSNWPHVPWPEKDSSYDPGKLPLPVTSVDTPETRQWRARYAAAVTKADDDLGTIRAAASSFLGRNVIFLFSGDNGTQWPFAKWNCYEAGVRVPLIVSWPDRVKPGARTDAVVSWVDYLPTLLEAAGGKPPRDIDGKSFLRVLRGKSSAHRKEVFTTHAGDGNWNIYPIRSLRIGGWKYIRNLRPDLAFTTHIDLAGNLGQRDYFSTWEEAAKTQPAAATTVTRYHARPAEELYHLETDAAEQKNLAADPRYSSRLKEMRRKVDKWMRSQGDTGRIYGEPRPLSDPDSFGPNAPSGDARRKK